MLGEVTVSLIPSAVRIEAPDSRWILISRAPDWTINIFSIQNKLIAQRTRAQWDQFGLRSYWPVSPEGTTPVTAIRRRTLLGVKATDYAVPYTAAGKQMPLSMGHHASYTTADDIKIPLEAVVTIQGLFGTSRIRVERAPLLYRRIQLHEGHSRMLPPTNKGEFWTRQVKPAVFSSTHFSVPKGYKTVPHEFSLIIDSDQRKEMESALTDLGVGEKLKKQK